MADETPPLDDDLLPSIKYRYETHYKGNEDMPVMLEADLPWLIAEVDRLRAFVREVAGNHEHQWEAVDPQEVWACEICHESSQDYATDVQTRAQYLLAQE